MEFKNAILDAHIIIDGEETSLKEQFKPGYHLKPILTKGTYGQSSKIREELEEFEEALGQDNRILALCELADIHLALEGVAITLGSSIEEIKKMSDATKRAFESGQRKNKLEQSNCSYCIRGGFSR